MPPFTPGFCLIFPAFYNNQALNVIERILLGAGRSPRGLDDLPRDHIKIDEPGERAMPDILELPSQHMPSLHREVGRFALQRLHAGQFIQTDRALPLLGSCGSLRIHLTALLDLLLALRIRHLG
jgi:hypothetical protein